VDSASSAPIQLQDQM